MLCLKVAGGGGLDEEEEEEEEEEDRDLYPPSSSAPALLLPLNIGNTIQRYLRKGKSWKYRLSDAASPSPIPVSLNTSPATCSSGPLLLDDEDPKASDGKQKTRSLLEQDITALQKQLEEEIDLHLALASAIDHSNATFSNSIGQLPDKAQELVTNIALLEITVSKLEEELVALHFQLSQERNERRLAEYRLRQLPSSLPSPLPYRPVSPEQLVASPSKRNGQGMTLDDLLLQTDEMEGNKDSHLENLREQPNQLSEEMVRCMINIFLCLADSSKFSSSGCMASPASPQGHLSHSSIASLPDSFAIPVSKQSPSVDLEHEVLAMENTFDPYRVQGKLNWTKYIGLYSVAVEVSWMSVGEKQLKYATGALKRFRLLVEQLEKVNPACLNTNERLAFWINLYNAIIMHAYLAYGVPKSEMKFSSLMQKAAYTVGGHLVSAADIEYVILKMRPPAHRPQITLVIALHKFKLPEEQRKYSIENAEPLVAFALSCGMHSSPAVRIFRPENVVEDLQNSLKDYIRASVGISSKGKLLVPKLLHSYTKGLVEDSMLPDWICRFLSPEQAAMVQDCSSHHKQRLLSPRSFTVLPFDSTFRYLFLPENGSSQSYA